MHSNVSSKAFCHSKNITISLRCWSLRNEEERKNLNRMEKITGDDAGLEVFRKTLSRNDSKAIFILFHF